MVSSFRALSKSLRIIIACDKIPYPPLDLDDNDAFTSIISTSPYPHISHAESIADTLIATPFVLIVPDGVRVSSTEHLVKAIEAGKGGLNDGAKIITFNSMHKTWDWKCSDLVFDYAHWTLHITDQSERLDDTSALFMQCTHIEGW